MRVETSWGAMAYKRDSREIPVSTMQGHSKRHWIVRNGIFPVTSVNRGCHNHQQLWPPWMVSWWVLREFRDEIKRCLLLGRKVMTNLDSIFKSRDITLPTKVRLVKAMVFLVVCMDVRIGLWRRLSTEELMLLNCGVGEDSWESLGLQGDPTSPS